MMRRFGKAFLQSSMIAIPISLTRSDRILEVSLVLTRSHIRRES